MAYTYRHGDRPLEGFTIQRAVGRGGFGEVYYAVSDGGREVALKYLRENPNIELRGISYCMNLKSPHLVSIFDVKANEQGEYFVVMEYVSGPSLRDLLMAEPNGLGAQKAAFFIREIAKGLAYLHDRGIVHRDLKPGNIFYDEGYVKIGDYGLSKFISVSRHSAQTASIGTVHYMAPEVGSGNYHRGIDIYALGVMLYEMLLGKVPFEGSSMGEVLMKHLTVQPEVDNLPAPFGKVIRKALEKDPADRYQTIYEMVDDLLEVEDVQTSLAGFNPQSLAAVEHRGTPDAMASPAPSPNPAPRRLPVPPANRPYDMDARPLPPKLAQRVKGISDRVEKRMRRLDARHGRKVPPSPAPRTPPTTPRGVQPHANAIHSSGEVIQRLLLALTMAIAMGVGVGFLVNMHEEGFASAILMIVGMSGGLMLGARLCARLSRHAPQPGWVQRVCLTVPAAGLLGIGVVPVADYNDQAAAGVWVALLIVTFVVDWRKQIETGSRGSMSVWQAGKVALMGLIATAIFATSGRFGDNMLALGAGVAAATSFVVQALGWLFPILAWLEGGAGTGEYAPAQPHDGGRHTWETVRNS
ncbi:MAG TPA: serine/threonine-protein kinase, partial [Phycisphaerae bacterium]|nr:serine/threonine-protein kinase [Phycisphaerae bacterium]